MEKIKDTVYANQYDFVLGKGAVKVNANTHTAKKELFIFRTMYRLVRTPMHRAANWSENLLRSNLELHDSSYLHLKSCMQVNFKETISTLHVKLYIPKRQATKYVYISA